MSRLTVKEQLGGTPQLMYDTFHECWALCAPHDVEGASYRLLIDVAWNGESWYAYRFVGYRDGDCFDVETKASYDQRVKDIEEYEGEAIAKLWHSEQTYVEIERDTHAVFALKKYWEAMMALDLFSPTVTHHAFQNMPKPSSELSAKLDALRKKEFEAIND